MMKILKKIIKYKLKFLAKIYLWRVHPDIVVVTGSANRWIFKEIIFDKINQGQKIRMSPEKYNAELGVPLSILGLKITKKIDWLSLPWQALSQAIWGEKADKIILELAIDKPNDMDYLLKIINPKVVIITNIEPSYMENFGTLDNIALEYEKLVKNVSEDGLVVLNNDDKRVANLSQYSKARVITFGIQNNANYQAQNVIKIDKGQQFKLNDTQIELDKFGEHYVDAELAGVIINDYYK